MTIEVQAATRKFVGKNTKAEYEGMQFDGTAASAADIEHWVGNNGGICKTVHSGVEGDDSVTLYLRTPGTSHKVIEPGGFVLYGEQGFHPVSKTYIENYTEVLP